MDKFSSRRLDNIKRNQQVLTELGAVAQAEAIHRSSHPVKATNGAENARATKRRRVEKPRAPAVPTRTSARIASAPVRPSYDEDGPTVDAVVRPKARKAKPSRQVRSVETHEEDRESPDQGGSDIAADIPALQASWSSWTPAAPPPSRDETGGVLRFASHPDFTPNKTPAEVLREGAFGGSYFRPLYSKRLRLTVSGDHAELPGDWTAGLDVGRYLTSPEYDAEANKFKVACGQSIEEWEAAGWIDHRFDVRGWFQWYCRFYLGRRCEDDERQVGRWKRCVGETGRWRRMLLKKYVAAGVREVWDDGADEDAPEVSPVMHQTCHHWAFEVTQDVLDECWRTGR